MKNFLIILAIFIMVAAASSHSAPSNLSLQGIVEWIPTGVASMTLTDGVHIGSGTYDTFIFRCATSTAQIASYVMIPPTAATAPEATGVIWYDSNANKLKCYDGSAWKAFWE